MYTPLPFHPLLGLQAPQTPTAEQETGQQHPEVLLHPGEAQCVPSRWQWFLAQAARSVSVHTPEENCPVPRRHHMALAGRGGKLKDGNTH